MKSFSKKEALLVGWQIFRERPFFLIGLFLVTTIVSSLVSFVADVVGGVGASVVLSIIDIVVQVCIGMGLLSVLLRVYDRADAHYGDLFEPLPLFWKYLWATILMVIVVTVGIVFFVVPGVIAIIALVFTPYLIVDRNLGAIEALHQSVQITKGHWWNLFFFGVLVTIINIFGAIAFGVGLFITIPVTALAAVHVYRWLLNPPSNEGIEVSMFSKFVAGILSVIAVVALVFFILALSSLSSVRNSNMSVSERDSARRDDVVRLQIAAELYRDMNGAYPQTIRDVQEFLNPFPSDPLTGTDYVYSVFPDGSDFEVCAELESVYEGSTVFCKNAPVATGGSD